MILTFIQGQDLSESKNFYAHFLAKFSINLDEICYVAVAFGLFKLVLIFLKFLFA